MGQKGHGTVISGAEAQGDLRIYISDNGSGGYSAGEQANVVNATSASISEGRVVELELVDGVLKATGLSNRGSGMVLEGGSHIQVSNAGGTGLSGAVSVSSAYGSTNEGWDEGATAYFGNVNGEAAYLDES